MDSKGGKPFLDFGVEIYRIWKGNAWNKAAFFLVFAGVTSITSILQYLVVAAVEISSGKRMTIPDTPVWLSLVLTLLGLAFFALGRWLPERAAKASASPHDVELFRTFRGLVTPNALMFLREHNFRTPFESARLGPIEALAYDWRGARYEFQDNSVQAAFAPVLKSSIEFVTLIGNYTYPCDGNALFSTPLNREDERVDVTAATWANIKKMNEQASALVRQIDEFERLALRRVPA
jgi:hypothetical protein